VTGRGAPGLPESILSDAARHFEACYPAEGCGAIVRLPDGGNAFRPIANVASAPDAFELDPIELLDLWTAQDRGELAVVAIVHSHCDAPAVLSARDRAGATPWPGGPPAAGPVDWLVFSVCTRSGSPKCSEIRMFRWAEGAWVDTADTFCLRNRPDR